MLYFRPPKGRIDFIHNRQSAFVGLRTPYKAVYTEKRETDLVKASDKVFKADTVRRNGDIVVQSSTTAEKNISPRKRSIRSTPEEEESKSPAFTSPSKRIKTQDRNRNKIVPVLQRRMSKLEKPDGSPPFYGFDSTKIEKIENGCLQKHTENSEIVKKMLQEKEDLAYAKKLQQELNSNLGRYSTRHSYKNGRKSLLNRQLTLDEIIASQCKVNN